LILIPCGIIQTRIKPKLNSVKFYYRSLRDPAYLELLTQIARAQGLQQKFDKAHQTLDQKEPARLARLQELGTK
jgi:hypothetical protein